MNLLMKGAALAPPFSCTTKYSSDVYSPRPPDIRVRLLPTKPPVHFTTEQPGRDIYALNKKDPDAIVYMDANEVIVRLTREDFASEEEFLKWKSWSDGNYHTEDNQDVVEGKHNTSIDGLSEAAFSIPAIDMVMDRKHEKAERRRVASTMVSQIRDKLTETQFRRLWMYYVDGMTVDEIGRIEGIRHQNISKSIGSAIKKIKKFFP